MSRAGRTVRKCVAFLVLFCQAGETMNEISEQLLLLIQMDWFLFSTLAKFQSAYIFIRAVD